MLTTRYKPAINRLLEPLARAITRCGISPSAITLAGPILGLFVCLAFLRTRAVVPFCLAITAVVCLDALDGPVARVSGRVTKFGAYLDAVCDRYIEVMVLITVSVVTGYWLWSMIGLTGSMLVSYTKARAAMEVPISNQEWPDLMERGERCVIYILGFAAGELIAWKPFGHDLFWWTLVVLSLLIHLTVVQRIVRAKRFIRERTSESIV